MSAGPVSIAVVGHTNTGKTSLMRTLLRDPEFGEVSDRPGITRSVAGASLLVDGRPLLVLFDTPGMEDSINLLDALDQRQTDRNTPQKSIISGFLEDSTANARYAQECSVLRQVLRSDLVLYVVDARDRVLGKHRDELEILRRCARPVVPVLNFIVSDEARLDEWRTELAHAGLHAVAEFDTVVFDAAGEERLFEKWRTLLHDSNNTIDALIRSRRAEREQLTRTSLRIIADLLIDVAGYVRVIPVEDSTGRNDRIDAFRNVAREREQACVRQLLDVHGFDPVYWAGTELPIQDGAWGLDLFSQEAMRQFGIRTGSAAGAGALAGLAVDALFGGLSLGAAAVAGATVGAIWSTAASHGRRLIDRTRGLSELRCDSTTLALLEARGVALLRALLTRGHAAQSPIRPSNETARTDAATDVKRLLALARSHPDWSALNREDKVAPPGVARDQCRDRLMAALENHLRRPVAAD